MGFFVTIEGGEFTGKSSVAIRGLSDILKTANIPVCVSREPGGTEAAEKIRHEIFSMLATATPFKLAEKFNEARKIHLNEVVRPFLSKHPKGVVLLDRYADSTFVYQGFEKGVPIKNLLKLHKDYADNAFPDHTIVLTIPEYEMLTVLRQRENSKDTTGKRDANYNDSVDIKIHITRQRGYQHLPQLFRTHNINRSFHFINSHQHPYSVIRECAHSLEGLLREHVQKRSLTRIAAQLEKAGTWEDLDRIAQDAP